MDSKRNHFGYVMIDHRNSPGVPDQLVVAQGLPAGAGKGLYEADTYSCSHCQFTTVINISGTRDLPWCKKCDRYLCNACGAELARTGICIPFQKVLDEAIVKSLLKLP